MKRTLLPILLALLCVGTGRTLSAQTATSCRPADETSQRILARLVTLATASTGPEAVIRDTLQLPLVTTSEVSLVTDETICQQAAAVYDTEVIRIRGTAPQSRRVYVIRVGTLHVVIDPEAKLGEFQSAMLFDGQFVFMEFFTL